MKNLIFCSFLFILIGCPQNPVTPKPTPIVVDTEMCDTADKHLAQLCLADSEKNKYCCMIGSPTKKGKTYTQFCIEKQNQGVWLNPRCVSQITSCEQIDNCTNSKI